MNMQIARLTNVSWLQVPDRRIGAMQAIAVLPRNWRGQVGNPATFRNEPVPLLDWPSDLFRDERLSH